jgi:hypothetical protein
MSQTSDPPDNAGGGRLASEDRPPKMPTDRAIVIKSTRQVLAELVETVDGTFLAADLPPHLRQRLPKLESWQIIEFVNWTYPAGNVRSRRAVWRLDEKAEAAIRYYAPDTGRWPCGHAATGFRNPRNVDGYQCPRDCCDETFDRETLEQTLGLT